MLNLDGINPTQPGQPPNLSLEGLCDLLAALEGEVNELPSPGPLFAHELERTLVEALRVADDDR